MSSCATIPSWGCISLGYILLQWGKPSSPAAPESKDGSFFSEIRDRDPRQGE